MNADTSSSSRADGQIKAAGASLSRGSAAERIQIVLFLLPALLLVAVFLAIPLVAVFVLSLTHWVGIGVPQFIGLDNFFALAADQTFVKALLNTLLWVLIGTLIHTPLCLMLALVMRRKPKGWKVFRTILFLPNIISATALALLWYFVFHVSLGLLNSVLSEVGLGGLRHPWLIDPQTALAATMTPWTLYVGVGMVLFLTQITAISPEVFEAARIDGASGLAEDWYITIPLVKRALGLQLLFCVGYALRSFEYPFIMTSGGPAGASTTLSLYIFREMIFARQYGLSMAAAVVTLAIGAAITALIFAFLRKAE